MTPRYLEAKNKTRLITREPQICSNVICKYALKNSSNVMLYVLKNNLNVAVYALKIYQIQCYIILYAFKLSLAPFFKVSSNYISHNFTFCNYYCLYHLRKGIKYQITPVHNFILFSTVLKTSSSVDYYMFIICYINKLLLL